MKLSRKAAMVLKQQTLGARLQKITNNCLQGWYHKLKQFPNIYSDHNRQLSTVSTFINPLQQSMITLQVSTYSINSLQPSAMITLQVLAVSYSHKLIAAVSNDNTASASVMLQIHCSSQQ